MPRQDFGLGATQTVGTNNIALHGRAKKWNFSSNTNSISHSFTALNDNQVEHDNRNPIQYLQATMYSLVYYINTLLCNKM